MAGHAYHVADLHCAHRAMRRLFSSCLSPQVISFYFEYLGHEKYKARSFCFVPGATTFLLINAGG